MVKLIQKSSTLKKQTEYVSFSKNALDNMGNRNYII